MEQHNKVIVLSCEHGGNQVPQPYQDLFKNAREVLDSHRGYDLGALELFECLDSDDITYKQSTTVSRLLVDINRSLYRRSLFSEFTKQLSKTVKKRILEDYYYAFRRPFEAEMQKLWRKDMVVLHLSVHSFTPVLDGEVRQTDFGILYNPEREEEKVFAKLWKTELSRLLPNYRVRFNYPFRGKPDGHVRYFRDREEAKYVGIEFEMNQKYANNKDIYNRIVSAFYAAFDNWNKDNCVK